MPAERPAIVVAVGRNAAWVALDDEAILRAASVPKRLERIHLAPGDRIVAEPLDEGKAIVERLLPRSATVERLTAGGRRKTMAANVDSVVIVSAFDSPALSLSVLDELLAFAELQQLGAVLIFTKPDLVATARRDEIAGLYRSIGYTAHIVNPKTGDGVAALALELASRQALLIGQSGAGKSSIYRALGGTGTTVGDLSKAGRGKQTTTSARLHRFPSGFLIDSPGIGEFAIEGVTPRELSAAFREFVPLSERCRFADCTHREEPDCAVREGVSAARIAESRYAGYRWILANRPVPQHW